MDNNINYWNERYDDMGGVQTVAGKGFTQDKYVRTNEEFLKVVGEMLNGKSFDTCLDFGCGIGRWQQFLSSMSNSYYGCDIVENVINGCRDNYGSNTSQFGVIENDTIPFGDTKFDIIWTCVVLQHVINDELLEDYIKQFYDRLKSGGTIILTENISASNDSNYLSFRTLEVYESLFKDFNIKMVGTFDFGIRETHGIFVGHK